MRCYCALQAVEPRNLESYHLSQPTHYRQAAKVAGQSVPETLVSVGEKGVHVSFEDWLVPGDVEDNSTIVAAVTTFGVSQSEGAFFDERRS